MKNWKQQPKPNSRQGSLVPLFGVAILVVGAGLALVLDRIWIDAAQVELRVAAEAAALAAGREYVQDEMAFRDSFKPELSDDEKNESKNRRLDDSRTKAALIAGQNLVAGQPIILDTRPEGEVRFGQSTWSESNSAPIFLETENDPRSVIVHAERSRHHGNPIALFFKELTGQPTADAAERAEATWDNRIVALRPQPGTTIPMFPIAIYNNDPTEKRYDTWAHQIELKNGADNYSFDASTGKVLNQPDGIPEIELRTKDLNDDDSEFNVQLLDFGNDFTRKEIKRQIKSGITVSDLKPFDHELRWEDETIRVDGQPVITGDIRELFEAAIGKQKICFLYETATEVGNAGFHSVLCLKPVCGRIMAVENPEGEITTLIFQPTVMISRTAVTVKDPIWSDKGQEYTNQYLYNLKLSH